MTTDSPPTAPRPPRFLRIFTRKNVLAGLMFILIGAFGLWASRHYPVGTALRMSTGYVPRLLCWLLIGLGAIVLYQGLREADPAVEPAADGEPGALAQLRPTIVVTAALIAFGLTLERIGLVLATVLLVAIASLATRDLKPWEIAAAAIVLIALSWTIFIFGLGLPIPAWPDW
jgi:putative tricarboxylic transport membrane protein